MLHTKDWNIESLGICRPHKYNDGQKKTGFYTIIKPNTKTTIIVRRASMEEKTMNVQKKVLMLYKHLKTSVLDNKFK